MNEERNDLDREKALEDIISAYGKVEEEKTESKERQVVGKERKKNIRRSFDIAGVVVIIILAAILALEIADDISALRNRRTWSAGRLMIPDKDRDECVRRMWLIRAAVDKHYDIHGRRPVNINELYDEGLLEEKLVCPASGEEYVFKKLGAEVFACPTPRAHKATEIWCAVEEGPPVVENIKR